MIRDFLEQQGYYNLIVIVRGKRFRLNVSQGVIPNPCPSEVWPVVEAPDDIYKYIEAEFLSDE